MFGVPLYSGFMYAAVASYMVQAWRLLDLEFVHYPSKWLTLLLSFGICLNFFTHHFFGDFRWWLTLLLLLIFRKTRVHFTPYRRRLWLPLPLSFVLIGFFVWVAENIATFFGAWKYPNQRLGWQLVGFDKISSWGLLVVITFVIVADLKIFKSGTQRSQSQVPCIGDPAQRASLSSASGVLSYILGCMRRCLLPDLTAHRE